MSTLDGSLSDEPQDHVACQIHGGSCGSASEFLPDLIVSDFDRRQLRAVLLDGARSPIAATVDAPYFESLRDQAGANS